MTSFDRLAQRLGFALAGLAGFVDALGFLSLGGIFVSFMSGNTTRLGVGLANLSLHLSALLPLGVIVIFVSGVVAGSLLRGARPQSPAFSVLALVAALLGAAALADQFVARGLAVALMALAMGAANNVLVRDGEVAVGVTYMTGALVKLGQRLARRLGGERKVGWAPYFLLWASLALGAVLGALSYAWLGLSSLWIASLFAALLALVSRALDRRVSGAANENS